MKRLMPLAFLALMVAAPASVFGANNTEVTATEKPNGKAVSDGWQPNERIVANAIEGLPNQREGLTPEGYRYHFSANGGQIEVGSDLWGAGCGVDAMTDQKWCNAYLIGRTQLVFRFGEQNSPEEICMLSEDLQPISGMIRVDKLPAHRTDPNGCLMFEDVKEIAAGNTVLTRIDEAGRDGVTDREMSLGGYSKALVFMDFIRQNADRLSYE